MDFLRKHYEKIILSLVLIGLAFVAVRLPLAMSDAKAELENPTGRLPKPKPVAPFDMSAEEKALNELTNPPQCVMSGENNTFNPNIWKLKPDGTLMRITQEGPAALKILKITPLYMEIAYDENGPVNGSGYHFTVKKNSEKRPRAYLTLNQTSKDGMFVVRNIKGPPESPTELELELPELKTTVWITTNKPYTHIDGYAADLRYPAAEAMPKKKVGEIVKLDGEPYKIIEITSDHVRVVSKSAKQYQIDLSQASSP